MSGCGHVYLPNDSGGVELSTAWCGGCGRRLLEAMAQAAAELRHAYRTRRAQGIDERLVSRAIAILEKAGQP